MKKLTISSGEIVLLDDEDYEKVSKKKWKIVLPSRGKNRVIARCGRGSRRLPNFILSDILDTRIKMNVITYKDGNVLNNQKGNFHYTKTRDELELSRLQYRRDYRKSILARNKQKEYTRTRTESKRKQRELNSQIERETQERIRGPGTMILFSGETVYIDEEDYTRLRGYTWSTRNSSGIPKGMRPVGTTLARFILSDQVCGLFKIRYKDGNKFNLKKDNLTWYMSTAASLIGKTDNQRNCARKRCKHIEDLYVKNRLYCQLRDYGINTVGDISSQMIEIQRKILKLKRYVKENSHPESG